MDDISYKAAHEDFVSNHAGSDVWELIYSLSILPPLLLISRVLQAHEPPSFWRDYLCVTIPQLLCLTILADHWAVGLLLYVLAGIMLLSCSQRSPPFMNEATLSSVCTRDKPTSVCLDAIQSVSPAAIDISNSSQRVQCLSHYKGSNMLLTCIAILAVDFSVFPRRFAKTETFGISLMDIGIGTFITSSAFTSRYARGCEWSQDSRDGDLNVLGYVCSVSSLQKFAVLALGVGRAATLRILDYQSHVSEYGTEWNFFVTLYVLWILADTVHLVFGRRSLLIFSIIIMCAYQYALIQTSLTEYILFSPRSDLVSSNREGLFSLIGCLSLFLICEFISHFVFFSENSIATSSSGTSISDASQHAQRKKNWLIHLAVVMVLTFALWIIADFVQPTSRRLFNCAFVCLCLFVSVFGIFLLLCVEAFCQSSAEIKVLELMNKHQLPVFLIANLLTGAINMSTQTIYHGRTAAIFILSVYICAVQGAAWTFDKTASMTLSRISRGRIE